MVGKQVARDEYFKQLREFNIKTKEMGLGDVENYYWYHTIDLGNGLVTPGSYDFRLSISNFGFPEDMSGMRVLDIGSATGFFCFEFERRGASVTSVELPSLVDLDRFPGQSIQNSLAKLRRMLKALALQDTLGSVEELSNDQIYDFLLEGPFQFCKKILGSKAQRCYSTVYDLQSAIPKKGLFDLIFIGDVLLHTMRPLEALAAAARLCTGTLVIAQFMPETKDQQPVMVYVGGEELAEDDISWWLPNRSCLIQILKKLGFRTIEEVGTNRIVMGQTGQSSDYTVLHALR